MRIINYRPEELIEGYKYRLEPNEEYSKIRDKIWYEIEVIEQFDSQIEFKVLSSNAEHTEGRQVLFNHDHAIFRTRNIYSLRGWRHEQSLRQIEEREQRHNEEPPRPIEEYEMSTNFRKSLIDIALIFNDEEWFKELTGASQVG